MVRRKVQQVVRFSQQTVITVNNNQLVVAARPGRTSLFLSVGLISGQPAFGLGATPGNAIRFNLSASSPSVKICPDDFGEVVGQPLWNISGVALRALVVEEWELPTGRCICVDE